MSEEQDTTKEGLGSGPTEEFRISGEDLVAKVKELIKAGNARRITIRKPDGETVFTIPLTAGVVVTALVPALVAVGAIATLAAEWIITVEFREG